MGNDTYQQKKKKVKASEQQKQILITYNKEASLVAQMVKNLPAMQETWLWSPVCLPGEFHGKSSLVGYSPWVREEWDITEWLILYVLQGKIKKTAGNLC